MNTTHIKMSDLAAIYGLSNTETIPFSDEIVIEGSKKSDSLKKKDLFSFATCLELTKGTILILKSKLVTDLNLINFSDNKKNVFREIFLFLTFGELTPNSTLLNLFNTTELQEMKKGFQELIIIETLIGKRVICKYDVLQYLFISRQKPLIFKKKSFLDLLDRKPLTKEEASILKFLNQ